MKFNKVEMEMLQLLVEDYYRELENDHDSMAESASYRELNGKVIDEDELQEIAELAEQLQVLDKIKKKLGME